MGKGIKYYYLIIKDIAKSLILTPFRLFQFKSFGKYSYIERHFNLVGGGNICIGEHVYIENNAKLWAVEEYGTKEYKPCINIGDYVRIAQNFHCTCAEYVTIGDGVSITANCGVFDIIHPYEDISVNPRYADIKTAPVVIGEESIIGMNTTILPGTKLGKHCVVGANSVVRGEFPDYCVIVGAPAKIIKRYDFEKSEWIKVK